MNFKSDLQFDNPNNACLSLRTVAELVRTGEIKTRFAEVTRDKISNVDVLTVQLTVPSKGKTDG